jgi:hypothetical protein
MLQRFLTQTQTTQRDDVDYMLDKLDRLAEERVRPARHMGAA